jgi:ABC-2 type transport system permease protein
VVAVFYPVSVLPGWLQPVALALPATHIFEGMREVMRTGAMSWTPLVVAFGLNLVYLALAGGFFGWILKHTRQRGLLTKFATQ